jgi:SLT domain-containing protein
VQPAGATVQPVAAGHTNSKSKSRKTRSTTLTAKEQPQSNKNTKTKSATKSFTNSIESSSTTTSSSPVETDTKYPAASYSVVKSYCNGGSFFDEFNFYTGEDPTHGFVQ